MDEDRFKESDKLKKENILLRRKLENQRTYRLWVLNLLSDIILGSRYKESGKRLAEEIVDDRNVTSKTLGDFITYTLQRFTRIGVFMIIPAALVGVQVYLLIVQNRLIKSQNAYIDTQNTYIKEQTVLNEATRRSST
ncbi:MAG: hypothetical protein KDC53_19320, partial [Saprospiraceae bacterium]|nr:hypothetical protein [Saprospiraceae bacterium]